MSSHNPAGMSFQEIADVLGMTRQAVSEIEDRALRKMKKILTRHNVYAYTDISIGEVFQFAADHEIHGDKYK